MDELQQKHQPRVPELLQGICVALSLDLHCGTVSSSRTFCGIWRDIYCSALYIALGLYKMLLSFCLKIRDFCLLEWCSDLHRPELSSLLHWKCPLLLIQLFIASSSPAKVLSLSKEQRWDWTLQLSARGIWLNRKIFSTKIGLKSRRRYPVSLNRKF